MAVLKATDYVAFFDDDCRVHTDYLANAAAFLDSNPDVAGITGSVLADGATQNKQIATASAMGLLQDFVPSQAEPTPVTSLYGCNFVVRSSLAAGLVFDDQLPLYGWLEDLDYSRRLLTLGRLFRLPNSAVVHLGSSSGGRKSHKRFGYSQIANPIYLRRKGSISTPELLVFLIKGPPNNAMASVFGPDQSGHFERLRGNFAALKDAVTGRLSPGGALRMGPLEHVPPKNVGSEKTIASSTDSAAS